MTLALKLLEHDGLAGLVIGSFALEEELGTGGFGVVYRGVQHTTGTKVAVKFLLPDRHGAHEQETQARFAREARLLSELDHPAIVSMVDFGEVEGLSYIALEYVDGINLRQHLDAHAPLPSEDVRTLLGHLLEALAYAHERGIVHRDVKPSNVMVVGGEEGSFGVKLMDFGVGKDLAPHSTTFDSSSRAIIGTPRYMSPEQLRTDVEVTPRSDLFSLGVVAHQALTGELPFGHVSNPHQLFAALLDDEDIVLPRGSIPDLDPGLADVVDALTRKRPAERLRTAKIALDALEHPVARTRHSSLRSKVPWLALVLFISSILALASNFLSLDTRTVQSDERSSGSSQPVSPPDEANRSSQLTEEEVKRMPLAIRVDPTRMFSSPDADAPGITDGDPIFRWVSESLGPSNSPAWLFPNTSSGGVPPTFDATAHAATFSKAGLDYRGSKYFDVSSNMSWSIPSTGIFSMAFRFRLTKRPKRGLADLISTIDASTRSINAGSVLRVDVGKETIPFFDRATREGPLHRLLAMDWEPDLEWHTVVVVSDGVHGAMYLDDMTVPRDTRPMTLPERRDRSSSMRIGNCRSSPNSCSDWDGFFGGVVLDTVAWDYATRERIKAYLEYSP